MKITMLATGSRGDTQPYIALGLALQKKGHSVKLAASEGFERFVAAYGLEFAPVRGDVTKFVNSELAQKGLNADNPLKFFTSLKHDEMLPLFMDMQHDMHEACQGADAVVYHPGAGIGYFAARELGIPSILATPFPMTPTREFPNLLFYDGPRLGRAYNLLTHKLFEQGFWMMLRNPVHKYWEKRFGKAPRGFGCPFPRQRTATHPTIISCSPEVFGPADWPEHVHCRGYWFLDDVGTYQPPAELKDFLEAGEAPVYVGFGSISDKARAAETTRIAVDALRRAGKRGILATGWNGMERLEDGMDDMLFIEGAPHDWLFPRMAAVVHHGGAGTTAAGLRAGVPAVVIPFCNDQFAWGRRIFELGVGARAIPRKRLTTDLLAQAVQYTQVEAVGQQSRFLGEKIRQERGAEEAAEVILTCIRDYHR